MGSTEVDQVEGKAVGPLVLKLRDLKTNMCSAVLGCERHAELLVTALLAQGHALIEGAPGMGKTSLARVMASSIHGDFKRIQFTPDLLPADVLGFSIYDQKTGDFRFHPGAVFCNILLADEINRTTPRVQSALLEAMNEQQVSIDGKTRQLPPPFFVIATQNHLHATGTFPLPESQVDRFLLSFEILRPDSDTQTKILRLHHGGDPTAEVQAVITKEEVVSAQKEVQNVHVADELLQYISALIDATHESRDFVMGASARAGLALMRASQATAFLAGRAAVYPDDIKEMAPYVLSHRLGLRSRSRRSGHNAGQAFAGILSSVAVP